MAKFISRKESKGLILTNQETVSKTVEDLFQVERGATSTNSIGEPGGLEYFHY
jgi:hypothetical protein